MRTARIALFALLVGALTVPVSAQQGRALDHSDYDIWNRIQNDVVSEDGAWLAYRLVPGDGIRLALLGRAVPSTSRGLEPDPIAGLEGADRNVLH